MQAKCNVLDWFENWFDSKYYHVLYKKRNTAEAQSFLNHVLEKVPLAPQSTVLDLACGKGRHSKYLNSLGFNVTGVDLSPNSIAYAQQFESESLHFKQMDMRHLSFENEFDLVVNMFTSFGYFTDVAHNKQVLQGVHKALKKDGKLVIDFLNASTVINQLVPEEHQEINDIQFCIKRYVEDDRIIKKIEVIDQDVEQTFAEKVSAFTLADFEAMLHETGFELIDSFGDYDLNPYEQDQSNRLILLTRPKL